MNKIENFELIPNLRVDTYLNDDNTVRLYLIYPCENYLLRITSLDEFLLDEDGNIRMNKNGTKHLVKPYRSQGGATALADYNFEANARGFIAEAYYEGIEDEIIEVDIPQEATESDYINALERLGVNFNG